jgi:hypothetical protein
VTVHFIDESRPPRQFLGYGPSGSRRHSRIAALRYATRQGRSADVASDAAFLAARRGGGNSSRKPLKANTRARKRRRLRPVRSRRATGARSAQ